MHVARVLVLVSALVLGAPAMAQAYEVGPPSKSLEESTKQQAQEAAEKQAKENAEKKQKEEAERQAAEARQREEAGGRQQAEAQSKEAEQQAAKRKAEEAASLCKVPNLKGDSLGQARTALRAAHCALGKVVAPHRSHGRFVVTGQSIKHGLTRPGGTTVAVTLGVAKKHR